jgi:hypothetical protein
VGCAHVGEHTNTPGIVEVSGTHYVAVMAKMPPAAPATEWMKESLIIVVRTSDIAKATNTQREIFGDHVEVLHMQDYEKADKERRE